MSSTVPPFEPGVEVAGVEVGLRGRDFLRVADLSAGELAAVLDLAAELKAGRDPGLPLAGRHVAMLFQRPSHRTRVSFEVGIGRLGGRWTTLGEQDVQIGVRETVGDAARVLDRYVDLVVARLQSHRALTELAEAAEVPVINALTEDAHPCQVLADLQTLQERFGDLRGVQLAYVGDGNNVARSLMEAATLTGLRITIVNPPGYHPAGAVDGVTVTEDLEGVVGADAIYTDVWASMGQEAERERRLGDFREYQVDSELMARAPDAIFLHCLPAHRGEEVAGDVIDGPRSAVFDQAENRLWAQMALMSLLVGPR